MVLPHEAANKEKENLKIGHKRIDDANENLQSKQMKPRRVSSNQKSTPSNKRKCNSCSAVLCHWEKWGEYLVEAGQSKEERVMGLDMHMVTEENASVQGCVYNVYKEMVDWPQHEQPPDCVYGEIKKLWPSDRYSDGNLHDYKPSSDKKSKRP
jgi:argonaute-like protein implicated in RNA metabolism and viral defense